MLKLYENIKALRLAAKMSQSELARRTGYKDRSAIAKIETGHIDLPQSKIQQFADVFGVTPGQLMGWDEETPTATKAADAPAFGGEAVIGDVIKSLRLENHLTMAEFSAELGIPVTELQQYEDGTKQLSANVMSLIAHYFGVESVDMADSLLLPHPDNEVQPRSLTRYVKIVRDWNNEFSPETFTDEELKQIAQYARFLLWQRKN